MSRDGQYAVKEVGEGLATRVLELPYGTDGRFSMFILLPERADGLRQLESRLNSQVIVRLSLNSQVITRLSLKSQVIFRLSLKSQAIIRLI